MLPIQFLGQNLHFSISLFAALVFFAVFWLYIDAWSIKRKRIELIKAISFLLVAVSFILHSVVIVASDGTSSSQGEFITMLSVFLRLVGYIGILAGQVLDPLQPKPTLEGITASQFEKSTLENEKDDKIADKKIKSAHSFMGVGVPGLTNVLLPLASLSIAILYLRRATTGLERHLKLVAVAFFLITVHELLALSVLLYNTDNPLLAQAVAPYGVVWLFEHAFLLAGVIVLGLWVWRYLTLRFFSQLFMIFITLTLGIFLTTAVSFSYLLVNNIQTESLNNLQTASNVLRYAIDAKKSETLANASAVADNKAIIDAVNARDTSALSELTKKFLSDKKQSSLIITSEAGQVLLRAEDPSRIGDSMSSNTLIRRAIVGESSSTISTTAGVIAPSIVISTSYPVREASSKIIGTVTVGLVADNAFVDGIKRSTGLESSIYAGNVRSATTTLAPDGLSRLIGVKDTNNPVQQTVLRDGKTYKGTVSIANRDILAVYSPLKDVDNVVIGMLFIGTPRDTVLKTASRSVEQTFIVTAILLLAAVLPAYLVSRYISKQLA